MSAAELICVEVVHAEPARVRSAHLQLRASATVQDALAGASAHPAFAGLELAEAAVGIFGRVALRGARLRDGDRVEIYRPLVADPKGARRQRARAALKKIGPS